MRPSQKIVSKTLKKSKAPGFEYWTRRIGNGGGSPPGRFSKTWTHRAERRLSRRAEYLASMEETDAVDVLSPIQSTG